MDTESHSFQIRPARVQRWRSCLTVCVQCQRQSEFNWQSVEINRNEERFAESTVVITHAIRFDSAGMWLIFLCFYRHSISAGSVTCMLGSAGDWPRWWMQPFFPPTASHDSSSPDSIYFPKSPFDKKVGRAPSLKKLELGTIFLLQPWLPFFFFPLSPISPCSAFIVRHTVPKCSLFLYHASTYTRHIMCAHSLPLNNRAEKELGLRVMPPDCLAQNMFQERKEITAEFHMEMLLLGGMKSTSSSPRWVSFDRFLPGTRLQERRKVCGWLLCVNLRSRICTSSSMW